MRYVTISRRKSMVASAAKAKVYIEDPSCPELVISGVPCRKLGELKNGSQQTFEVGEASAKLFVIAGNMSKNYCNDFVQLPAGTENLFYTGQNELNPINGNAFRFDNNDNPEAVKNRKKSNTKGIIITFVTVAIAAILGYLLTDFLLSDKKAKKETFSANGMHITLTDEFEVSSTPGYTFSCFTDDIGFAALEEPFSTISGAEDMTLEEYGELVLEANGFDYALEREGDKLFFRYKYQEPEYGLNYCYTVYLCKEYDAFWLLQFYSQTTDLTKNSEQYSKWVDTVRFDP